jgi:hypothetical protein
VVSTTRNLGEITPGPAVQRMRGMTWVLAACMLTSCALTPVPVGDALAETQHAQCRAAVAAFRADPGDVALSLEATHMLFALADVTVQTALLAEVQSLEQPTVASILAVDQELPATVRDQVLSLATAGAEAAEAAVTALTKGTNSSTQSDTAMIDAQVHLALHLSFMAWANGPVAALMSGYPKRIGSAMDAAMTEDPMFDHGAPLRLKGRFLAQAPWPVGDQSEARKLLARAVANAPMPIHHLFFGDLLWRLNEPAAAMEQWRAAVLAQPDASTEAVAPMHREMAKLRLLAVERAAGEY